MTLKVTKEQFEYLDKLRKSGKINMFGAPTYVAHEFHVPMAIARAIWGAWADSFEDGKSVEERVSAVNNKGG